MNEQTPTVSPWLSSREKRIYDKLGAVGGLLVAVPVIAAAALAIVIVDRQNPFFVQPRLGKDGKFFNMYKIRTLRGGDHGDAGQGPHDTRASFIGRLLRKTGIDELPQLVNVVKGDMSIAGPRAMCDGEAEAMNRVLPPENVAEWRDAYVRVLPGVVSEFVLQTRGATAEDRGTPEHFQTRADLDAEYVASANRRTDLRLCGRALAMVVRSLLPERQPALPQFSQN